MSCMHIKHIFWNRGLFIILSYSSPNNTEWIFFENINNSCVINLKITWPGTIMITEKHPTSSCTLIDDVTERHYIGFFHFIFYSINISDVFSNGKYKVSWTNDKFKSYWRRFESQLEINYYSKYCFSQQDMPHKRPHFRETLLTEGNFIYVTSRENDVVSNRY